MTQLFFMDESGHDHGEAPYEVRGGIAIHVSKLWNLVQDIRDLELQCFGCRREEIKGSKLLSKKSFKLASQGPNFPGERRKDLVREFMKNKERAKRDQYTAYGQACLKMAQGVVDILVKSESKLFAAVITRGIKPPQGYKHEDFLRKDQVFMFERFFYLLAEKDENGVIVMDETEKKQDRRFVSRMEKYFTKTERGRKFANHIVPSPFFVSSDMSLAVQVADLCIYAINWGFRTNEIDAETRPEIETMFAEHLGKLQYYRKIGRNHMYGINLVRKPYESGS